MKSTRGLLAALFLVFSLSVLIAIVLYCDFCYDWLINNISILISSVSGIFPKLLLVVLLFALFKLVSSFVITGIANRTVRKLTDPGRSKVVIKFILFIWWSLFSIITLIILVGNLGSLITSIGLIGLGLTFALQKPILNLGGYITIAFNGVYSEGDRIRIADVRGDVKEIRLMNTVVEALLEGTAQPSGKLQTFPNEFVLTHEVENFTRTSNYVLEELKIGITYESDYNKAMKLLKEIVTERIKKGRSLYKKRITAKEKTLNLMINSLKQKKKSSKGKSEITLTEQEHKLELEKEKLADEKRELEEEFKPKIRMEFLDSAIEIIVYFQAPYNKIKLYRSHINIAFMNAIKEEKDIEIAYPHMQIVPHNK